MVVSSVASVVSVTAGASVASAVSRAAVSGAAAVVSGVLTVFPPQPHSSSARTRLHKISFFITLLCYS